MKISISVSRKKGIEKSGIGIKIIGIAHSSFTVGNEILSCRLLKTVPNVLVTVNMIGRIWDSSPMIDISMSRSGEGRQYMIGWGVGLMCMKDLVDMSIISQGIKKNLKR